MIHKTYGERIVILMKKMISLFVAVCLLGGAAVVAVHFYQRSHKVWIPVTDEDMLNGVDLLPGQKVYNAGDLTLSFTLKNNSEQTISFDATIYHDADETTYQDGESPISLQKMVDGQWCRWDIPEQSRDTQGATAGVEAEVASGSSCGPFILHSRQYLNELSSGNYRAVFPFYVVENPSDLHNYVGYAEFEVS